MDLYAVAFCETRLFQLFLAETDFYGSVTWNCEMPRKTYCKICIRCKKCISV